MNEFILVVFYEIREVVINGAASGYNTGEVIEVPPGTNTISLDGAADFTPTEQDVNPTGTNPLQPETVTFTKV